MIKITTKKFDPQNPPDGAWVKYQEGAEIQIRKMNKEILHALRAPFITISMEYDPQSHKYVEKETADSGKIEEALTGYLVQKFRGFGDDDGNVLPDTQDSREALMNDLAVRDFVWGYAHAAEIIQAARQDTEVKN